MKDKLLLLAILCLTWVASISCSSDKEEDVKPVEFTVDHEDDGCQFPCEASSMSLVITAPSMPSVTVDQAWLRVSTPVLTNASYKCTISVDANETSEARAAVITVTCLRSTKRVNVSQQGAPVAPDNPDNPENPEITTDYSGRSAMELAKAMYNGINIGNTLEATGGETSWGAEVINRDYIHGLKAAGFNAVRIPCSWNIYMGADNKIDPDWLNRVFDVVGYCIDENLYVILNDHWDNGWIENDIPNGYKEDKAERLRAMWTQIADKLEGYDQRLMFAGFNEPNAEKANIPTLVKYQQVFVDAVRATGGRNADRVLVIQAPNTSLELAVEPTFVLPADPTPDRLMVEAHFYGPYNFTLMEKDESWGKTAWFWGEGNSVAGHAHNSTWGDEKWVREQCQLMYSRFTSKGIPAIMGEYGCMVRYDLWGTEYWDLHQKSRRDWCRCVVSESKLAGIVPFLWDTPGGLINRKDGHVTDDAMLDSINKGAESAYPF